MNSILRKTLAAGFLIGLAGVAQAEPLVLACPASLGSSVAAEPVEGWESSSRESGSAAKHALTAAGFSDGNPNEKAFLAPSGEIEKDGQTLDQYEVSSVTDGLWLICNYADTPLYLFKQVPGKPQKCEAPRKPAAESVAVCE